MIDAPPPPAIHYTVEGDREAVVLLNGGMMSGFAWEAVAMALASSYRVVRLDFRGQLMSPAEPPPDLAGHAADVIAVLDRLHIERAHLVGTSFGALVGLVAAAEHPDRVLSLVAMTATARLSPQMIESTRVLRTMAREAASGGDGGKILDTIVPATYSKEWIAANAAALSIRRAQVAALPKTWFTGLDGLLGALERADPASYLTRIRCPTAVVGAEKDLTFPLPNSEELARSISGSILKVVPGASHGLVLERSEETIALLKELLPELSRRAAAAKGTARITPGSEAHP